MSRQIMWHSVCAGSEENRGQIIWQTRHLICQTTDALLQNFRHTLCFRTEDAHTIDRLHRLIGQVDVAQASYGASTSTGTTWSMQGVGSATTETSSTHVSLRQQAVLDAQRLRTLGPDQVVAVLSLAGMSADDVLDILPVYA